MTLGLLLLLPIGSGETRHSVRLWTSVIVALAMVGPGLMGQIWKGRGVEVWWGDVVTSLVAGAAVVGCLGERNSGRRSRVG